jgi:amino acid adenylation domain-containing protein
LNLTTLAAEILGEDPTALVQAQVSESFLGLGGDSLRAMELVARAHDELRLRIRLGELLSERPFAEAAESAEPVVEEHTGRGGELRRSRREQAPHSASGLMAADALLGGSAYNLVFAAHMSGPLRIQLLEQAMHHIVRRHEQLRTSYPEPGHAEVLGLHLPLLERIAGPVSAPDFESFVRAVAEAEGRRRMLPSRRPPLRFLLVSAEGDQHKLIIIVHHAMVDGWAIGLLVKEIFAAYDSLRRRSGLSLAAGPVPQLLNEEQDQLARSGELGRQSAYWMAALREVPSVLELPSDLSRPATQDPRGARLPFGLSADATEAVRSCARRLRITPFGVFLASYALVIARYTGQRRFVIGVPVARRSSSQAAQVIAYATNVVPVIAEVDDAGTAGTHLSRTGMALAAALQHADVPLSQLVRALDIPADPRRSPLVQFVFGMHDQFLPSSLAAGELNVQLEEGYGGRAPFDFTFFVQRADPGYSGVLEFATSVATTAEAAALLGSFVDAVSSLASRPDRPLADSRCITRLQEERLTRLNRRGTTDGTGRAQSASVRSHSARSAGIADTVQALVLQQAQRTPDAMAVHDAGTGHRVTYRELARSAAAQARRLRSAGVAPGARVLVALPRSAAEIVGLLGILQCGAAYVAVDPDWPASRLRQIIGITRPAAVLAVPDVAAMLTELGGGATADIWQPGWAGDSSAHDSPSESGLDRTAYVAFTSGSTGVPKGVCVPHRAVIRLVMDADYVRCGPGERFLRFAPLAFDASTLEIWAPLANGGIIEIYSGGFPAPAEFGAFLVDRRITALWLTSGLFRLVADLCPVAFRGVHQILTGGDVVPPQPVRRLLEMYPGLRITNGYGPTENTTFTTVHHLDYPQAVDDPLPIGHPIRGTKVFVLDDQARLAPPGAVGELYAAGDGLASGYLGNPAETARRFGKFSPDIPHRLYRTGDMVRMDGSGNLQFIGRLDQQVKIRGFRIELEEVRQAILDHPAVEEAVVAAIGDTSAERRLLAAVMPARGALDDIRSHIATRLPAFMRPALWLEADKLPVTPNGKVDVVSLTAMTFRDDGGPPSSARPAEPFQETSAALHEGTAIELVRDVMAGVLKRKFFGDEDNFFDLGGDSLGISRLLGILRKRHHISVRLRDFYAEPTAKRLATLIELSEVAGSQASSQKQPWTRGKE